MVLQEFVSDLNLKQVDKKYLLILLLFSILLTIFLILFNNTRGAFYSDIFVYLGAALDFAQMDYNNVFNQNILFNSPVICFLTSLLFRLGLVSINALFVVTGAFGILGILGMYVLLRFRFTPVLSFAGAMLYSSFAVNLYYFANGLVDVPAAAILIWTLIFTIIAVDKNPKYYLLVMLAFIIGFFTRYTNGIVIFLIALYMLKNTDNLSNFIKTPQFKWIVISLVACFMVYEIVVNLLISYGSNIRFMYMIDLVLNNNFATTDTAFVEDKFFYLQNYLSFLFSNTVVYNDVRIESYVGVSPIAVFILLMTCYGFILKFNNIVRNRRLYKTTFTYSEKKFLIFAIIVLACVAVIGLFVSFVISIAALWLIFALLIHNKDKLPTNKNNFALTCVFMALFLFYFIIFSQLNIKCARYIIPTFPAVVYFVIYSLEQFTTVIRNGWDDEYDFRFNLASNYKSKDYKSELRYNMSVLIPIILVAICLFYAFAFPDTCPVNEDAVDIQEISQAIVVNVPDYPEKKFATFNGTRFFEWYFQKDVKKLKLDQPVSSKYDYVIAAFDWNSTKYDKIYTAGQYNLYGRNYV